MAVILAKERTEMVFGHVRLGLHHLVVLVLGRRGILALHLVVGWHVLQIDISALIVRITMGQTVHSVAKMALSIGAFLGAPPLGDSQTIGCTAVRRGNGRWRELIVKLDA